jgi:hypothetical protein
MWWLVNPKASKVDVEWEMSGDGRVNLWQVIVERSPCSVVMIAF